MSWRRPLRCSAGLAGSLFFRLLFVGLLRCGLRRGCGLGFHHRLLGQRRGRQGFLLRCLGGHGGRLFGLRRGLGFGLGLRGGCCLGLRRGLRRGFCLGFRLRLCLGLGFYLRFGLVFGLCLCHMLRLGGRFLGGGRRGVAFDVYHGVGDAVAAFLGGLEVHEGVEEAQGYLGLPFVAEHEGLLAGVADEAYLGEHRRHGGLVEHEELGLLHAAVDGAEVVLVLCLNGLREVEALLHVGVLCEGEDDVALFGVFCVRVKMM